MQRRDQLALARPIDLDPLGAPGRKAAVDRGRRFAALLAVPAGATAKLFTAANWDVPAQRMVVRAGLMSEAPGGGFAGASPLSAQAAAQAMAALSARQQTTPVAVQATARITLTRFDSLLVAQLGLADVAAHVQRTAADAGLKPPGYFGTEVVARYLGLRYNHPSGEDSLELYPSEEITRAEAAHSLAVALEAGGWSADAARQTLEGFSLPRYSPAQLQVLRIAVSKIGMPYVWAGTTDGTEDGLQHGGYDCSGSRGASTRSRDCRGAPRSSDARRPNRPARSRSRRACRSRPSREGTCCSSAPPASTRRPPRPT